MSNPKKTRFIVDKREACADNSSWVLNIDGSAPGGIYAYIDEEVLRGMNAQFAKRADTSEVFGPHRVGYAIEYVNLSASLREMLMGETSHFDCDDEIDRWVEELESLAQYLKDFKEQRREEAQAIFCGNCLHPLLDHERPDGSDSSCDEQACGCRRFFPIESRRVN